MKTFEQIEIEKKCDEMLSYLKLWFEANKKNRNKWCRGYIGPKLMELLNQYITIKHKPRGNPKKGFDAFKRKMHERD